MALVINDLVVTELAYLLFSLLGQILFLGRIYEKTCFFWKKKLPWNFGWPNNLYWETVTANLTAQKQSVSQRSGFFSWDGVGRDHAWSLEGHCVPVLTISDVLTLANPPLPPVIHSSLSLIGIIPACILYSKDTTSRSLGVMQALNLLSWSEWLEPQAKGMFWRRAPNKSIIGLSLKLLFDPRVRRAARVVFLLLLETAGTACNSLMGLWFKNFHYCYIHECSKVGTAFVSKHPQGTNVVQSFEL